MFFLCVCILRFIFSPHSQQRSALRRGCICHRRNSSTKVRTGHSIASATVIFAPWCLKYTTRDTTRDCFIHLFYFFLQLWVDHSDIKTQRYAFSVNLLTVALCLFRTHSYSSWLIKAQKYALKTSWTLLYFIPLLHWFHTQSVIICNDEPTQTLISLKRCWLNRAPAAHLKHFL